VIDQTKKILTVFGTRPEAIKLAPLVLGCASKPYGLDISVCVTSQHKEMLTQVLDLFNIRPDYDLDIMEKDQDLFDITSKIILRLRQVLEEFRPDVVVVQGDTSTAFLGALAAFYMKIPVGHVEAGLRTRDKYNPFPEELNRSFISSLTDLHFAPTEHAKRNLLDEQVPEERIFVTGNTVIDALMLTLSIQRTVKPVGQKNFRGVDFSKRIVLVTGHRRESFGKGFRNICTALRAIAESHDDIEIVYPVHLNPNVRSTVMETLKGLPNIHLKEPMNYAEFVYLMDHCYLILTDSGGVQEEAPSIGKPVLVMRNTTERPEAIQAGTAILVGTEAKAIVEQTERLLENEDVYKQMASVKNPYGDGKAAERIIEVLGRNTGGKIF